MANSMGRIKLVGQWTIEGARNVQERGAAARLPLVQWRWNPSEGTL